MAAIDLSSFPWPRRVIGNELFIWDPIRKKTLKDRPEERVRQQFITFLRYALLIPSSRIGVEVSITGKKRGQTLRADIVTWQAGTFDPEIIVEVKSSSVRLSHQTLTQLGNYQKNFLAPWWVVVNGSEWLVFEKIKRKFVNREKLGTSGGVHSFPAYDQSALDAIINNRAFSVKKEDWYQQQYQRGFAWDSDPEKALRALELFAFLGHKPSILEALKENVSGFKYEGMAIVDFDPGERDPFWNNRYLFIRDKNNLYAMGIGPAPGNHAAIFIIIKDPTNKYREHIITLTQLQSLLPVKTAGLENDEINSLVFQALLELLQRL